MHESLLVGWYPFFVLDLCFDVLNRVGWLYLQCDGFPCKCLHKDLHGRFVCGVGQKCTFDGDRTRGHRIKGPALCRLSYKGKVVGGEERPGTQAFAVSRLALSDPLDRLRLHHNRGGLPARKEHQQAAEAEGAEEHVDEGTGGLGNDVEVELLVRLGRILAEQGEHLLDAIGLRRILAQQGEHLLDALGLRIGREGVDHIFLTV